MFLAGEKCAKDSVSLWLGEISSGLLRVSTWDLWALLGSLLWRRQWQPTLVLLPGKFRDGGAWWAAFHGVAKSQTWLSDFSFPFHFPALEKEMATHSSVLARRIPGMGKPGGLPSGIAQGRTQLKWLSSSSSRFPPGKPGLSLCNFYPDCSNMFFFNFRIKFRLNIGFYVPIIEA